MGVFGVWAHVRMCWMHVLAQMLPSKTATSLPLHNCARVHESVCVRAWETNRPLEASVYSVPSVCPPPINSDIWSLGACYHSVIVPPFLKVSFLHFAQISGEALWICDSFSPFQSESRSRWSLRVGECGCVEAKSQKTNLQLGPDLTAYCMACRKGHE